MIKDHYLHCPLENYVHEHIKAICRKIKESSSKIIFIPLYFSKTNVFEEIPDAQYITIDHYATAYDDSELLIEYHRQLHYRNIALRRWSKTNKEIYFDTEINQKILLNGNGRYNPETLNLYDQAISLRYINLPTLSVI